jgi:hypothetical protein
MYVCNRASFIWYGQSSDRPTILETEIKFAPILCYKSGPNLKVQHQITSTYLLKKSLIK